MPMSTIAAPNENEINLSFNLNSTNMSISPAIIRKLAIDSLVNILLLPKSVIL